MTPPDNMIAFQSTLQPSGLVKCFCPLSHGKTPPKFLNLRKDKLSSRWKTGLQLSVSGRGGASLSAYMRLRMYFVVQVVATVPRLDKDSSVPHETQTTCDNVSQGYVVQSRSRKIDLEDLKERDHKEYNKRVGISKGNKGRTPWNKGRKHSPETIERIRERTKQAMQDPKVKKKLQNCGRPHSEETRMKIGMSMKRRYRLRQEQLQDSILLGPPKEQLQDSILLEWTESIADSILLEWKESIAEAAIILLEWEESIAEAARIGVDDEEELQWNSYEILFEKGPHEARKAQYQKISQAIKAKWTDPEYRKRISQSHWKRKIQLTLKEVRRIREARVVRNLECLTKWKDLFLEATEQESP